MDRGCCQWNMFNDKPIRITVERSVPLPLGLATFCTLVDTFGRLKETCEKCETTHDARSQESMYRTRLWLKTNVSWPRVVPHVPLWEWPSWETLKCPRNCRCGPGVSLVASSTSPRWDRSVTDTYGTSCQSQSVAPLVTPSGKS